MVEYAQRGTHGAATTRTTSQHASSSRAVDKLRPILEQVDVVETAVSQLETMAVQLHTQSKELEAAFADLLS